MEVCNILLKKSNTDLLVNKQNATPQKECLFRLKCYICNATLTKKRQQNYINGILSV